MTDADISHAISEIRMLKARYFRMLDTQDWPGLEAVLAPDLIADVRDSTGQRDESMLIHGAAAFVAQLVPALTGATTVHHGHTPEIRIESPITASGIWAMEDRIWPSPGSILPYRFLHGYGHYHDRYVQLADGWRIAEFRLARLRVDIE